MSISHLNNDKRAFLPFKGNSGDNNKSGPATTFVAGSAVLGGIVGAATPERYFIKTSNKVTPENLRNLLKDSLQYSSQLGNKGLETLHKTINSALNHFDGLIEKYCGTSGENVAVCAIKNKDNAKRLPQEVFEQFQAETFNKLKNLVPREPLWQSTAKGAAIAGGMAFGLVVMSKVLSEIPPPPEDMYKRYEKTPSLTIKHLQMEDEMLS